MARQHDLDYRPAAIQDNASGGLSLHYGYDAAGQLTELQDGLQSAFLARYDYDHLGRLIVLRDGPSSTPIETYTYDATGNRTSLLHAGVTKAFTYPTTSHRLSSADGIARTYDGVGNTTAIGGSAKQFNYAEDDRMSSVQQGGAIVRSYAYNALGERVLSTIPTVPGNPDGSGGTPAVNTYTVYDGSGRWLGDYDHNGAVLQQAIWLDDLPVGLLAGSGANQKLHYIEPDHLGTPRAVIDRTRDVAIWTWALQGEAFGNSPPNQDPDLDSTAFVLDMRFPGQRYDAATGLNYNYFRDYDAASGRYVQSDPIGLSGDISTYAYSGGGPLTNYDPFGLDWIEYNGREMSLYGGKIYDRTQLKRQCSASSGQNVQGYFDYRNSAYQNVRNYGPTPEGVYYINLGPSPSRVASVSPQGYLMPSPDGGIERIPAGGEQVWGRWRARLTPAAQTNTFDRDNMYLHDSSKGETSGCIETCTGLIDNFKKLRAAGVRTIDVLIDYPGFVPTGRR